PADSAARHCAPAHHLDRGAYKRADRRPGRSACSGLARSRCGCAAARDGLNMATFFITGSDTGVGKTHASCALLRRARSRGVRACGYKPVASGCMRTRDGLRNDDALALLAESASGLSYAQINPFALEPA